MAMRHVSGSEWDDTAERLRLAFGPLPRAARGACHRRPPGSAGGQVSGGGPTPGPVIRLWNGATTTLHSGDGEATTLLLPPDDPSDNSAGNNGAAVFTRGGDRLRTGWLGAYAAIRR